MLDYHPVIGKVRHLLKAAKYSLGVSIGVLSVREYKLVDKPMPGGAAILHRHNGPVFSASLAISSRRYLSFQQAARRSA